MGLEVYYPTDVRNALLAAEQAVNAMADAAAVGAGEDNVDAPQSAFTAGFLTGYRAALTTLALAFGLGLNVELSGHNGPARQPAWQEQMPVIASRISGRRR